MIRSKFFLILLISFLFSRTSSAWRLDDPWLENDRCRALDSSVCVAPIEASKAGGLKPGAPQYYTTEQAVMDDDRVASDHAVLVDSDSFEKAQDFLKKYCRGDKAVQPIQASLDKAYETSQTGQPLDTALKDRKRQQEKFNEEARGYFMKAQDGDIGIAKMLFTMKIPESVQKQNRFQFLSARILKRQRRSESNLRDDFGIGSPYGCDGFVEAREKCISDPDENAEDCREARKMKDKCKTTFPASKLIKDQPYLWANYIDKFTTTKEIQGKDPNRKEFRLSLDMALFCRTAIPVVSLLSKNQDAAPVKEAGETPSNKQTDSIGAQDGAFKHYCSKGRQVHALKTQFVESINPAPGGIPLDVALSIIEQRREIVRERTKRTFLDKVSNPALDSLKRDFTMLIPPALQKKYRLNCHEEEVAVCGFRYPDEISIQCSGDPSSKGCILKPSPMAALEDREMLWASYIKNLTVIKEAVGTNPREIRFAAELNLGPFCAYGRPVSDFLSK